MNARFWMLGAASLVSATAIIAACTTGPAPKIPLPADGSAGSFKSEPVTQFERAGKKSGYLFATPETQTMQKDDFENPAFLLVVHGEQLWTKAEGAEKLDTIVLGCTHYGFVLDELRQVSSPAITWLGSAGASASSTPTRR